jgi:regulator of protease activity HflC (stomatin/prohibitin superfamily)
MYWAYILGIAIILYLISSLRVLRQYERGVVFLLGKFDKVRGAGHLYLRHYRPSWSG